MSKCSAKGKTEMAFLDQTLREEDGGISGLGLFSSAPLKSSPVEGILIAGFGVSTVVNGASRLEYNQPQGKDEPKEPVGYRSAYFLKKRSRGRIMLGFTGFSKHWESVSQAGAAKLDVLTLFFPFF